MSRRWLIHRETWQPGDLVVVTDRRLLWITDRYKNLRERYGRVTRSARLSDIRSVSAGLCEQGATIDVRLRDGEWPILVNRELAAAAGDFARAATGAIKPLS